MRLIDADALLEKMKKTDRYFNIVFDIEAAPTIDAEPVTRCKDCENSLEHNGQLLCIRESWLGYPRRPEDFCSRAIPARKEDRDANNF